MWINEAGWLLRRFQEEYKDRIISSRLLVSQWHTLPAIEVVVNQKEYGRFFKWFIRYNGLSVKVINNG